MKRTSIVLGLFVLAVGLAACSSAAGAPASAASSPSGGPRIVAKDLKFQTSSLELPANKPVSLDFVNEEGAPHNVAIYTDRSGSQSLFVGEVISNASKAYQIPALAPGSYFFRCDVHQDMTGTITAR